MHTKGIVKEEKSKNSIRFDRVRVSICLVPYNTNNRRKLHKGGNRLYITSRKKNIKQFYSLIKDRRYSTTSSASLFLSLIIQHAGYLGQEIY